jgi:hypothetical protein
VRELVLARRAGALAVAAAAGALVATPALADVTVSPQAAVQGGGADFDFKVTNTGDKPIGTVTLTLPADSPVAEAYPLSTDNWAPKITTRKLTEALPSIHTGIPVTEATSAITWIAMPGSGLAPGTSTDLRISLGPMPTLSNYRFSLTTAYSDGSPGPAMTPPTVTLTRATAEQQAAIAAEHAGHEAAGDTGTTADDPDENAQFAQVVGDATRGPSIWSIVGWIVAGAALLGGAGLMFRSRHRAEEDDEPSDEEDTASVAPTDSAGPAGSAASADSATPTENDEDKEPVAAGKWSLKEE